VNHLSELGDQSVQVRVLGPVAVVGSLTNITDMVAGRILQTLVLSCPLSTSIETLVGAIWGEHPPKTWKSAFRTHLSVARSVLLENKVPLSIEKVSQGFELCGDLKVVDAFAFRDLLRESRNVSDPAVRAEVLRRSVALWTGEIEPILFDGPLVNEADRLLGQLDEARRALFGLRIELGDFAETIIELRELFEADTSNEVIAELLASALMGSARFDQARDVLSAFKARSTSLGLIPGQGIQALTRQLLMTNLGGPLSQLTPDSLPGPYRARQPTVNRLVTESILSVLREVQHQASMLVVYGPAGVGKSFVAAQIARDFHARNAVVLSANAQQHGRPFQPLRDLLGTWQVALEQDLIEIDSLFFEVLDEGHPDRDLLIIIDDSQWLDIATTKVLSRLCQRGVPERTAIVLLCRPGEESPFVTKWLREASLLPEHQSFDLNNFSLHEVLDFVKLKQPQLRVSEQWRLANQLFDKTGGLPILCELIVDQHLEPVDVDEARLIPWIGASTESEFSDIQRRVLATAAIVGFEFSLSIIAEAVGVSLAAVIDAVDHGRRLKIIGRRSGSVGLFRHELTRSAAVDLVGAQEQAQIHRSVADVLQRRNGEIGRIALHRASALIDVQQHDEIAEALRLVEGLQHDLRWEDSLRAGLLVDRSLRLQPWLASSDDLFTVAFLLGSALQACEDWHQGRAKFVEAFDIAEAQGDADKMSAVAIASFGSNQPLDGDPQRLRWLKVVIDALPGQSEKSVQAMADYVYLESLGVETAFGTKCFEQLNEFLSSCEDLRLQGLAWHGVLAHHIGSPGARDKLEAANKALLCKDFSDAEAVATALLVSASSSLRLGFVEEAKRNIEEFGVLASKRQRVGDQWISICCDAVFAEWAGEEETSTRLVDDGLNLALRHELPEGISCWGVFQIGRSMRTDDWSLLAPLLLDVPSDSLVEVAARLCTQAGNRDIEVVRSELAEFLPKVISQPRGLQWIPLMSMVAYAATKVGGSVVDDCIDLLTPYSGSVLMMPFMPVACFGPADRLLSRLYSSRCEVAKANQLAQSSDALCDRSGLVGWSA
jgi:DNA-binding SARP family transcriptional activator